MDSEEHRHQLVDVVDGRVEAFADPALEAAIQAVAERHGFELTGHDVILRGYRRAGARDSARGVGQ